MSATLKKTTRVYPIPIDVWIKKHPANLNIFTEFVKKHHNELQTGKILKIFLNDHLNNSKMLYIRKKHKTYLK